MTRTLSLVGSCLALLLALAALPAHAADPPEQIATRLLDRLATGDYAAAEASFSKDMAAAVPADKLKAVWESLPAQAGAPKGRGTPQVSTQGAVTLVQVPLHYAKAGLVAKIAMDGDGRIAGFLIQPVPPPAAAAPSADAAYTEHDLAVGSSGERALPGTLTLPKGAGPFPAVVLVHGSGPHDRNETIGPNRPFLDIARGLGERGIAALRYEKRTHARPQDFASGDFDVDDETTDDAVAAKVARLRGDVAATGTPMGLPAAYWHGIDGVDAIAEAQAIRQPLLLQGGRDIQVVDADWQRWQAAFGHDSRTTLRHYPALNHLGIAGEGPGTLAEYQTAGHVDAQLIADVAAWIRAR